MEPPDYIYILGTLICLAILVGLYFFGVWLRSYVLPSRTPLPLKKQLLASIPVGLLTMGVYAKSALPALALTPNTLAFDGAIMAGYAIIFGMLSRESLERLLTTTKPPTG